MTFYEVGRIAYDGFARAARESGASPPPWEDLYEFERGAWIAAAGAVVDAVRRAQ